MDAFTTFKGIGIPIDIINCDTDQIIPGPISAEGPQRSGDAHISLA